MEGVVLEGTTRLGAAIRTSESSSESFSESSSESESPVLMVGSWIVFRVTDGTERDGSDEDC